jgi:hypothetical protein
MIGFAWKYFDQGSVRTVKDLVSPGWYASRLGSCGVDVKVRADSEISAPLSPAGSVVVPAGLQAVEPATKPIKRKSLNFIN